MFLLDLIFPKRCVSCGRIGAYLCKVCQRKIVTIDSPVCPLCQRQAIGGKTHPGCVKRYGLDGLIVASRYSGPVKIAIAKIKYRWIYDICSVLIDILAANIWRFDLPKNYILVPVPLHARRKNWRGFNQAELLVEILAKKFSVSHADLLVRTVNTGTQVSLDRDQRRKNVKGAFAIRGSTPEGLSPDLGVEPLKTTFRQAQINYFDVVGKNVILVDDVYTSGATMAECAKVLKRAGAKSVWGMAVALG